MFRFRLLKLRITLLVAVLMATLALSRISLGKVSNFQRADVIRVDSPAPVVLTTLMLGDARDVFAKINFQRRKFGLRNLIWDEGLAKLATAYAEQMATEDFFSHFDPQGRSIVDRAEDLEIKDWLKIGENLYKSKGYVVPTDIAVDGWMESDSHRENIIDPDWTHTGVGVYKTKDSRTYIVQTFMMK